MNTNLGREPDIDFKSSEIDGHTIEMMLVIQKPHDAPDRKTFITSGETGEKSKRYLKSNIVYYQLNFVDGHQLEERIGARKKWLTQETQGAPIWYAGKTSFFDRRGMDRRTMNKDCLVFVRVEDSSKNSKFNHDQQSHLEFLMIEDLLYRMGKDGSINVDNKKRELPKFERDSDEDKTLKRFLKFILKSLQEWNLPGFDKTSTHHPWLPKNDVS
jgi:hypothetical protein